MTILEEEKHTASASSAGSKDSHLDSTTNISSIGITTLSPSSGQNSTTCNNLVVQTSGQQQALSISPPAAVTRIVTSEVNATKNLLLSNMISNVADRYITPEYLAPLPSSVSTEYHYLIMGYYLSYVAKTGNTIHF